MAQEVACLHSKHKALSLKPHCFKRREVGGEDGGGRGRRRKGASSSTRVLF
jgi:hypothetical protein